MALATNAEHLSQARKKGAENQAADCLCRFGHYAPSHTTHQTQLRHTLHFAYHKAQKAMHPTLRITPSLVLHVIAL